MFCYGCGFEIDIVASFKTKLSEISEILSVEPAYTYIEDYQHHSVKTKA